MNSTFALLSAAFFLTAVVSFVTGGTSLITVPVMLQCGMDPHVAVATNMLALVFLSLGGSLNDLRLRKVFLAAVLVLAVKLFADWLWRRV